VGLWPAESAGQGDFPPASSRPPMELSL